MRIHKLDWNRLWAGISADSDGVPPGWVESDTEPQAGQMWSGSGWIESANGMPATTTQNIDELKDDLIAKIDALSATKRDQITAGVSPAEMASWTIKRNEAIAYQDAGIAATDDDAPTLAAIAAVRGITTSEMVAKVLANATALLAAEIQIDGIRGKHADNVNQINNVADLLNYDIYSDWII